MKLIKFVYCVLALWILTGSTLVFAEESPPEGIQILHSGYRIDEHLRATSLGYDVSMPYWLFHNYVKRLRVDWVKDFRMSNYRPYFFNQETYLWGNDLDVKTFQELLKSGDFNKIQSKSEIEVLETPDGLSFESNGSSLLVRSLKDLADGNSEYKLRKATLFRLRGGHFMLKLGAADREPLTDPNSWEILMGIDTQLSFRFSQAGVTLQMIGKPQGEELRRIGLIKSLKRENPQALLIHSGNVLAGLSSIRSGQLSLQRQNTLKEAASVGYTAISLGLNEFRAGIEQLKEEQKTHQLQFICANLVENSTPVFPAYRLVRQSEQLIAFIGITSPEDLRFLKGRKIIPDTMKVLPIPTAIDQTLNDILLATGRSPDLVIVVTNSKPKELSEIKAYAKQIQLIISDMDAPYKKIEEQSRIKDWKFNAPIVVRSNNRAVNHLSLTFDKSELTMNNRIIPVTPDMPPDSGLLPARMKVRQEAFADAFDMLLPDVMDIILADQELRDTFTNSAVVKEWLKRGRGTDDLPQDKILFLIQPRLTKELMLTMMSNILIQTFNSELVLLPMDYVMPNLPGALPRLMVYELLQSDGYLERYYLSGKQVKSLMGKSDIYLGGLSYWNKKIWNRVISDREQYKTIVLSDIPLKESLKGVFAKAPVKRRFKLPYTQKEQKVYLRDLFLDYLENLKKQPDKQARLAKLLKPSWNAKQHTFAVQIEDLKLNTKNYNTLNNQSYDKVRVTRVNSPDNLGAGGSGGLALIYDSQDVTWTNKSTAKFDILSVDQENPQENQDDLNFSSQLTLNFFQLNIKEATTQILPFMEVLYDTEFTPTVTKDGVTNPLQSELSGVWGLSLPEGNMLKRFKMGFVVKQDFNNPNRNIEVGANLDLLHQLNVLDWLVWKNDMNIRYLVPSPNDNESDLGFITKWISTLKFSLTENLSLDLTADAFIFQGKLPSTSRPGASVLLSAGLSYDRLWKPNFEPFFKFSEN